MHWRRIRALRFGEAKAKPAAGFRAPKDVPRKMHERLYAVRPGATARTALGELNICEETTG
jgi:hypothetical protein